MTKFDLEHFLPYRLAVLSSHVSTGFALRYGRRFGLGVPEWRVIAHLSQADAVSVRDIYRRVDMDKSKVSRAASRLQSAGLVAKRRSDADKRLVTLSLTASGKATMAKLAPLARTYEAELKAKLTANDRSALDRIFRALVNPEDERPAD